MKKISNADIAELSREFGYEFASIKAIALVEGSGEGFNRNTGLILLQFEPHLFLDKKIANGVDVQSKEWAAFNEAYKINPSAAIKATSWGMFQILGDKYELCGYNSPQAMLNEFKMGEYFQMRALLNYINSQKLLKNAIRAKDWKTFARWYNGVAYKRFKYDTRLAAAYETALKINL